jgi:outer membrane protein assembly factor BamA
MYKMKGIVIIMVFWLGATGALCAQKRDYRLFVQPIDSNAANFPLPEKFASRAQCEKYLQALPSEMLSKGYLSASIDSIRYDSLSATIRLFAGSAYTWKHLEVPPEYRNLWNSLQPMPKGKKGGTPFISIENYRALFLNYFEENGFPFAAVSFDSVTISDNQLSARLQIDKGPSYKIDSIAQLGKLKLNPRYIHRYLELPKGSPYSTAKLQTISQRLDELPFAEQTQPWDISMLGTGGVINVYLQPRKNNIFNVLLGVMPSSTQTPDNKVQVTGDVNIQLNNSFRVGETLGVNWQQIQYKSPRLNLMYRQPYLWGSRAGIDFFFELFKKDTQFVNLTAQIGMPYAFSINRSGKVFLLHRQTNVITVDTAFVSQNGRLPDLAATSSTSLGVDVESNTTNYRFNPRSGNEWKIHLLGGTKKITPSTEIKNMENPSIPGKTFASLYDSLALNTYQVRLKLHAAQYLPLGTFSVIKLGLSAGWFQSANYFRNELFQIGGFKLLRGFDEESIFARQYAVATAEYRLLSSKNAYFFGFADGGYAQYEDQNLSFDHWYWGTGIGLNLQTGNSLINLSWAVGKRDDLLFDIRQSKIHLGLVNFF